MLKLDINEIRCLFFLRIEMKGSFGSNFELLNAMSSCTNDDIIQLRLTPTIDPTVAQVDSNLKSLLLLAEDASRSIVSITIKIYSTGGSYFSLPKSYQHLRPWHEKVSLKRSRNHLDASKHFNAHHWPCSCHDSQWNLFLSIRNTIRKFYSCVAILIAMNCRCSRDVCVHSVIILLRQEIHYTWI